MVTQRNRALASSAEPIPEVTQRYTEIKCRFDRNAFRHLRAVGGCTPFLCNFVIQNPHRMKIFRSEQIKQIDELTIREEPVASIDLMERAASTAVCAGILHSSARSQKIFIFAGPGNNGGDGLALARLLESNRYQSEVHYIDFTEKTSDDWKQNLLRLKSETSVPVNYLTSADQFPLIISPDDIIIDAIFGSGLTRRVEGSCRRGY